MEEDGLGENQLARALSRGVILDEYVIKFFKEYNLNSFVTITELSNVLVKELEDILFLLDSNEIDFKSAAYYLSRELKEFEINLLGYDLNNKYIKKLMVEISSWFDKEEKLIAEISSLSSNKERLMKQDLLVEDDELKRSDIEKNKRKIETDIRSIISNIRRTISKVLDAIANYQNNQIKDIDIDIIVQIINENYSNTGRNKRNQVFLSHAFVDRLFTLGLFLYFYQQNVYLYVDWMHQSKNSKTKKLKGNLIQEITKSDQLLFLRTLNSELALQGGTRQIREWCAWEIGTFDYKTNGSGRSRFYIDRFRQNKQSKSRSQLIQDFKPLREIQNGSLY